MCHLCVNRLVNNYSTALIKALIQFHNNTVGRFCQHTRHAAVTQVANRKQGADGFAVATTRCNNNTWSVFSNTKTWNSDVASMDNVAAELRSLQSRLCYVESILSGDVVTRLLRLEGCCFDTHSLLKVIAGQRDSVAVQCCSTKLPARFEPSPQGNVITEPLELSEEPCHICTFAGCPGTNSKHSTASAALRHMQVCKHCVIEDERYYKIVIHMGTFNRHPRVGAADTCWVCAQSLQAMNSDARTRHRKVCIQSAQVILADPTRRSAKRAELSISWMVGPLSPQTSSKRERPNPNPVFAAPNDGIAWAACTDGVFGNPASDPPFLGEELSAAQTDRRFSTPPPSDFWITDCELNKL